MMKLVQLLNLRLTFLGVAAAMVATTGCQPSHPQLNVPYTAQVVKFFPLNDDQPASDPVSYQLDTGTFSFLKDVGILSGDYFALIQGAQQVRFGAGFLFRGGHAPQLRYEIKNGIIVPQDFETLAMFSTYYHFDTIARELRSLVGIDINAMKAKHGVYRVLFEPFLQENSDSIHLHYIEKRNAAFVLGSSNFLIFRRSSAENLPLAVDLNIISHEFGHAIWDYLIDYRSNHTLITLLGEYAIRGLNEGWADFFSFALTGSTNVISNAFNSKRLTRERNFSTASFSFDDLEEGSSNEHSSGEPACTGTFYCIGTLFAKSLYEAQETLGVSTWQKDKRSQFAKLIAKSLSKVEGHLEDVVLPPAAPREGKYTRTLMQRDGRVLGIFFKAFLSAVSDSDTKAAICNSLVSNFGNDGFPTKYRVGCE